MDFNIGILMTMRKHDSIMVVVDNLTKSMHFILVKSTTKTNDIAKIFMKEIFRLHGRGCSKIWELNSISIQFTILRQMVRQKE